MVQLFYYETRGKNYKKLMSYEGAPFKVTLFPNEDVGSALNSYLIIKIPWWSKSTAKVLEVSGTRYRYSSAKVVDLGNGTVLVKGLLSDHWSKNEVNRLLQNVNSPSADEKLSSIEYTASPKHSTIQNCHSLGNYFRLHLSTSVSNEDFQRGYSLTGTLERAPSKELPMTLTHFAVVKRKGY